MPLKQAGMEHHAPCTMHRRCVKHCVKRQVPSCKLSIGLTQWAAQLCVLRTGCYAHAHRRVPRLAHAQQTVPRRWFCFGLAGATVTKPHARMQTQFMQPCIHLERRCAPFCACNHSESSPSLHTHPNATLSISLAAASVGTTTPYAQMQACSSQAAYVHTWPHAHGDMERANPMQAHGARHAVHACMGCKQPLRHEAPPPPMRGYGRSR